MKKNLAILFSFVLYSGVSFGINIGKVFKDAKKACLFLDPVTAITVAAAKGHCDEYKYMRKKCKNQCEDIKEERRQKRLLAEEMAEMKRRFLVEQNQNYRCQDAIERIDVLFKEFVKDLEEAGGQDAAQNALDNYSHSLNDVLGLYRI